MLTCKPVQASACISCPKRQDSLPFPFIIVRGEEVQSSWIRVCGPVRLCGLSGRRLKIARHYLPVTNPIGKEVGTQETELVDNGTDMVPCGGVKCALRHDQL